MSIRTLNTVIVTITVLACLPYLSLKLAWITGSTIGIPAGSPLIDPSNAGFVQGINALTLMMDCAVIGLAVLLTRPLGHRLPAWLMAGPTWIAAGLLGPIVVGFLLQLGAAVFTGPSPTPGGAGFLEPWVFQLVYGGFIVQGVALGTLFFRYAASRWGHLLQSNPLATGPTVGGAPLQIAALVASILGLVPLTMQVLWSTGAVLGLPEAMTQNRGLDQLLAQASHVPFTLAAIVGIMLLAFTPGVRGAWASSVMTWLGSGALFGWGGWSLLTTVLLADESAPPTAMLSLVATTQLLTGATIALVGGYWLAKRSASYSRRTLATVSRN